MTQAKLAVTLRTGVDEERPLAGSSQHERGAEPGGSTTHDNAIPGRFDGIDGGEPPADLSTPLPYYANSRALSG